MSSPSRGATVRRRPRRQPSQNRPRRTENQGLREPPSLSWASVNNAEWQEWSRRESNPRPLECHSSALPTELRPHRREDGRRRFYIATLAGGSTRCGLTRCGLTALRQVAARVDRRAVDAHLVVEVRPGGAARGADGADRLAATHALALAYVERGEMPVERVELAAVSDDDDATVARVAPGEDLGAVAGRGHRRAVARRDVDAGVHLAALAVGGPAGAEGRGDEPAHGPQRRHAAAHLLAALLHQHAQQRERVAGGRGLS